MPTRYGPDGNPVVVAGDAPVDAINPAHYRSHPSGIECIEITRHMSFNLGNAIKYIWRARERPDSAVEDLQKAKWYLEDEIKLRIGAADGRFGSD